MTGNFLSHWKRSAACPLCMRSLDGLQGNVCAGGKRVFSKVFPGCTRIILVSAALSSILMELHGGSSIMGYSRYNSVTLKS